ncbi:inactive C-alpha-formylglycine-generating enzyme 2 isoform X2 [Melospiza georgiana]|uniref:inactive C-alpha-formylglycine-generating enzyme 2 isoform X2 n=1 Tax=Melospiza georgiana TaxID=44398 RepID=UPI0025AD1E94|nr:inactive C-alpha-formylglycine-generating enzyme 2 isoform X2 [Melospiza georgiana]
MRTSIAGTPSSTRRDIPSVSAPGQRFKMKFVLNLCLSSARRGWEHGAAARGHLPDGVPAEERRGGARQGGDSEALCSGQTPGDKQGLQSAPWWLPIEKAFWRQPSGPGSSIKDRLDYPVLHVSWNDAQAFCAWQGKRLPSEEEWEFAARGGLQQRMYPWGNKFQANRTNLWQGDFPREDTAEDGYHGVSPVTAFPAQNSYGLYDLLGNTWEWTASEFPAPGRAPRAQKMQVLRGASWIDTADGSANHRARVTTRMGNTPDSASDNLSFRCAADIPPVPAWKSQSKAEL